MAFVALVPPIVVNVKQYGAAGDGVTDDTAAILSALAAIPTATGGVLYFPPNNTYLISAPIDISSYSGNIHILGGGWSSVIKLANGANCYIIQNTTGSQTGTRVSNIKLICNNGNQTAASGGISGYKWRRCLIDFVWIHSPWQAGILLTGDPSDFGYQNRICNNFIDNGVAVTSGTNAYGEAIRLINTDENHIYGNHFDSNGNPNDATYGCHIYDQNGLSSYFGNSFVNGMFVLKFDGLQNRVFGNAFDGNGGAAIQINGSASATIVKNNTLINIGYVASGGAANSINGIYVNASQCIIEGNYFQSDASTTPKTNSFVKLDTGATYAQVTGNEFNVQAGSGTVTPVLYVSGRPTGARVRNNNGFNAVSSKQIWVTESYGHAQIISGNTSIVVTHGLSETPTLDQISVTPQSSLGSATTFWISNVTSTSFTINTNVNPAATVTFSWRANCGY